jgi:Zn-dependent protease
LAETFCPDCGSLVPPDALSCPNCHRLTHAARLEELAQQARAQEPANPSEAQRLWSEALTLLPPDAKQAEFIRNKIAELGAAARIPPKPEAPKWIKKLGPLGGIALLLWKFKAFVILALSKAKFLFLGLGKLKTLGTMLLSIGVYWSLYGWPFAFGFIGGIYVHEMGHVWELRRLGLRASVPMFIPGLGALISLYDSPANHHDDARIGLAGPIWGAATAIAFGLIALLTGAPIWFALTRVTAWLNLFNLTPVWQLDGGRGFRALSRNQRFIIGGIAVALWMITGEVFLFFIILGAAYRLFWQKDHDPDGDVTVLIHFAALVILLALIVHAIPLPAAAR